MTAAVLVLAGFALGLGVALVSAALVPGRGHREAPSPPLVPVLAPRHAATLPRRQPMRDRPPWPPVHPPTMSNVRAL